MNMMEQFDFSMINDEPVGSFQDNVAPSAEYDPFAEDVESSDEDDLNWGFEDETEEGFEDTDAEEIDQNDLGATLTELTENFGELPDDLEFTIGDAKVTKKDLAEVVAQREFISKSNKEFEEFTSQITEQNMQIESHLNMALTEARIKFEHYTKILQNADKLHASDVQKALRLQKEASKRYGELEQHGKEYRRVEEQRQQEVDVMRIRRTDAEMKGKVAGYRGITETLGPLMQWAQEQGMPQEGLMKTMSPALVQALMDAKEYRDRVGGKKSAISAAAKAKTKATPRSVSNKPKAKGNIKGAMDKRRGYEHAMKSGDSATAFQFLVD